MTDQVLLGLQMSSSIQIGNVDMLMKIKQSSEELQFPKSEFHWTVLFSVIRVYELAFNQSSFC